ncbi:MAG: hypothetical protein HZA46_16890 [Planctomycetales bacterium]|nr:hypothetical protein [Planctomycetales bacterium]
MRDHTEHQKKIIRRYYDNRDQIDQQRLSELVTELFLAEGKKRAKLWQTARDLMTRMNVPPRRIEHVVTTNDPAILLEVVKEVNSGLHQKPPPAAAPG